MHRRDGRGAEVPLCRKEKTLFPARRAISPFKSNSLLLLFSGRHDLKQLRRILWVDPASSHIVIIVRIAMIGSAGGWVYQRIVVPPGASVPIRNAVHGRLIAVRCKGIRMIETTRAPRPNRGTQLNQSIP